MKVNHYILQTAQLIDFYSVQLENIVRKIKYKLTLHLDDDKVLDDILSLVEEYGQTYRDIGQLETLMTFLKKTSVIFQTPVIFLDEDK